MNKTWSAPDRVWRIPMVTKRRNTALVVSPDAHGQGIGRRLLREVETLARRNRAVRVEVTSNPSRTGAHAFYHACGYSDGSRHFVKLLGD